MSIISPFRGKKIHILGVAGTLMAPFACFLKREGIEVTGSDQNIYPPMSHVLERAAVAVTTPFSTETIDRIQPDLVIVGNVIRATNPEIKRAQELGIPYQSLPQALETMILPQKWPIVIAGTHGKTTTASMAAWMLECLAENPSFFVGGVLHNFPESFRLTDSRYMVLEGDEYDTAFFDKNPKFLHYRPQDLILTSIEYDHADIYPDMQAVVNAFDRLVALLPDNGRLVVCAETETPLRVARRAKCEVLTYGFSQGALHRATSVTANGQGTSFLWNERKVFIPTTGRHNVLNALSCLALAQSHVDSKDTNWDIDTVVQAMSSFRGVKRRQEIYGTANGITLIDDFAHHPTAVRETLAGIRAKHPTARLVACFEPRSATSRRKVFQQAYSEAFDDADLIYIAKPFEPTLPPGASTDAATKANAFSSEDLLRDLKTRGKRAKLLSTEDSGLKEFSKDLRGGDVVLVMSNGSFDGLLPRVLQLIS